MSIKSIFAGSAAAAVILTQTAFAGSLAPVVDCNVTPEAEECAVVTLAPNPSSSAGLGGLGAAGTAAAVGGGLLALGALAAIVDDNDDDDESDTDTAATTE